MTLEIDSIKNDDAGQVTKMAKPHRGETVVSRVSSLQDLMIVDAQIVFSAEIEQLAIERLNAEQQRWVEALGLKGPNRAITVRLNSVAYTLLMNESDVIYDGLVA